MESLHILAILVAGLMVGGELAIAAFLHPTLEKLPDDVHLPAASALALLHSGEFFAPPHLASG